jgi:predicted flap endonuclease-1-like 5' DNA nuclease
VREYLPPSVSAEKLPASAETAPPAKKSGGAAPKAQPEVSAVMDSTAPAPQPSHVAKTELAAPEQITAADAPPAPPAKKDRKATAKTQPEAHVVMESTAASPQSYETEKTGQITPETAEQVAEGKSEETPVAAKLTKKASRRVATQETTGAGTPGKPDDLLRIDGVGPKSVSALQAAGIDSFQKLANTSEAQILEILTVAKVRLVANYTTWAQQAAYAARGDWEGFDRFNHERKAQGS